MIETILGYLMGLVVGIVMGMFGGGGSLLLPAMLPSGVPATRCESFPWKYRRSLVWDATGAAKPTEIETTNKLSKAVLIFKLSKTGYFIRYSVV